MYGLADCNNFYASCERMFAPDLNGRPVVVLSNNDGCIIARSDEAKALGLKMGDAYFQQAAFLRQNNVAVFSSNLELYGDMSTRVMNTLKSYSPATEVYSIDESFMDFTGIDPATLRDFGLEIVQRVKKNTGIPISLGIAPTKTLAKIASKLCKQYPKLAGCCYMHRPEDIEKVLRRFPIGDVWGIGRRFEKKLLAANVATAYDFTQLSPEWVRLNMGGITALRMWKELRGEACIGFDDMPQPKQQIRTSRTFHNDVSDYGELHRNIALFTATSAEKLRKQQSVCGEIRVFILTNRHRPDKPQSYENALLKLPNPTDSTIELVKYVGKILRDLYSKGYGYKRAGVVLSDIRSNEGVQINMFDPIDRDKHTRIMAVMDALNKTYGRNKISLATQGATPPYRMNREHLSQRYTTSWDDIIQVKAM